MDFTYLGLIAVLGLCCWGYLWLCHELEDRK